MFQRLCPNGPDSPQHPRLLFCFVLSECGIVEFSSGSSPQSIKPFANLRVWSKSEDADMMLLNRRSGRIPGEDEPTGHAYRRGVESESRPAKR